MSNSMSRLRQASEPWQYLPQLGVQGVTNPLAGLRIHDLRHTAATKLLELGTPIVVVAQILGWSASTAVRMTKRYGHIRPETQRRALDAVAMEIVHQAESEIKSDLPN
jgi:integrase